MSQYYDKRSRAYQRLKQIIKKTVVRDGNSVSVAHLADDITTSYGFGRGWVEKQINQQLEETMEITMMDGKVEKA